MKSTQHGMSLIELVITVSIAAILIAIGVPSYRYVTTSNRVSAEVNGLLLDMQFARSEAIKEGRTVTVCPATPAQTCNITSNWNGGWIVFMDINDNAQVDGANEVVLRTQSSFPVNGDQFVSDSGVQSVTFNREGFAAGLPPTVAGYITVTLHDSTGNNQWTRCLQVNSIGKLRTERYGDSKGNCL